MSWFSRVWERLKRLVRRERPELEIPIEKPEIEIAPPIAPPVEEIPITPEPEKEEVQIPEEIPEEKPEEILSRVVTFEERIRGTRIRRTLSRSYPLTVSESDIHKILENQYDSGGNFVLNVKSIEVKETPEYEEEEIDRGMPGSADVSP